MTFTTETGKSIERAFLDFFKNHNISVYKANNNADGYSKLSIPESQFNESIEKTPCN